MRLVGPDLAEERPPPRSAAASVVALPRRLRVGTGRREAAQEDGALPEVGQHLAGIAQIVIERHVPSIERDD
jgi:hypothetical protein